MFQNYELYSSVEHKRNDSEECCYETAAGHHSFPKSGQNTTEANGYQKLFGYPHSSKYLLLCSTDTGLEQHEGK